MSNSEKPNPGRPNSEKPNSEKPNPEKPNPEKPNPGRPNPEKPNPEDSDHGKVPKKRSTEKTEEQRRAENEERRSSSSSQRSKKSGHKGPIRPSWTPKRTEDAHYASDQVFESSRIDPDEPLPATSFVSWRIDRPVALHMAKTGPLAQKPLTIMTVLKDTVNKFPTKMAYASMVNGQWVEMTYQTFLDQINQAAQGFLKLGLQRFYGVGIFGDNSVEYLVAHFGAIFAGGVSVPVHIRSSAEFSFNLIKSSRCRVLVVDSIKARKQVLEWRQNLPILKAIVQYGHDSFDKLGEDLYTWQEFLKMGNDVPPELLHARIMQQAPNLCCCVAQTTGASEFPKNVMISHDNVMWGANTIGRYLSLSDGQGVILSFLPFSTFSGLTLSVNVAIRFAVSVYILPATRNKAVLIKALKEVRPTIFIGPTMFYESLRRELEIQLKSNCIKRIISNWAMNIGRKGFDDKARLPTPPSCWSLANALLFRKVRKKLGFDRCNEFFAAGAVMRRDELNFYLSIDMPLLLAYGTAESTGTHTACLLERYRIDSVGLGLDGCKTKIADPDASGMGELQIAGRNVAMGYLDSEELTTRYFKEDGTFRTGDLARKDEDGFTYILGKKMDIVTLSGGEKILTVPIHWAVTARLPFVSHPVVVGEGKPYLSLLMTIKTEFDAETDLPTDRVTSEASAWFRRAGYDVKSVRDIVPKANPKLLEKIQTVIDQINAECPHEAHKVKRWTFLSNDFSTATDELGPTLRIRRWIIEQKYAVTIESMYA